MPEDAPLDPRNVYAATKTAQEHLAASWARATGGTAVALRYHNVYGPHMPKDTPYAGVASLFRSALARGEAPRVFEDGGQRRDFVHVRDVARANLLALAAAPPAGTLTPYNVASGTPHTVGDMARELARAAGGPEPVVTGRVPPRRRPARRRLRRAGRAPSSASPRRSASPTASPSSPRRRCGGADVRRSAEPPAAGGRSPVACPTSSCPASTRRRRCRGC